jgi:hypothetical protein
MAMTIKTAQRELGTQKIVEMIQPPMNADKRRWKINNLSAFICVYRRPICFFGSLLSAPNKGTS